MRLQEQLDYELTKTVTFKVGGQEARATLFKLIRDIELFTHAAGPEGIVVVALSSYIPKRGQLP